MYGAMSSEASQHDACSPGLHSVKVMPINGRAAVGVSLVISLHSEAGQLMLMVLNDKTQMLKPQRWKRGP